MPEKIKFIFFTKIKPKAANVILQRLQGKRIQSEKIRIKSNSLETDIGALYGKDTRIEAESGRVNLSNLHGFSDIRISQGNLDLSEFA